MPDNVNPHAQSKESARKLGDSTTYSINEPGPGAPKPFKVPEDHTVTTAETLKQDYPDGYVAPVPPEDHAFIMPATNKQAYPEGYVAGDDPDDLEDEIAQAEEDGDFKSMHRVHKSPKKRK